MDIKLFFLIILLVFLYYFPLNSILDLKESFKNELFKNNIKEDFTYQRCKEKPLGRIMGSLFNQFNILKSVDQNFDIYVPCGYNNVESELLKIKGADNKYVFGINGCDHIVSKNYLWFLLSVSFN